MTRVSITQLKAQLSRYIREVRRGGEIQILDRGVPVARITRVAATGREEQGRRNRLVEAGIVRPGRGGMSSVLERPPIELGVDLSSALIEERADRL